MPLSVGTHVGPYEVLALLGAGGMGEVYRAKDPRLGREVAVKVLPGDVAADAGRRERFEQEARAASSLNHPNILTVHDIGEVNGSVYVAMELVEGKTLREIASGEPLPSKKLLEIGVQIADGLAKAHAIGIVHRDLKPENLMVSKDGFVKILDFGLAKLVEPESQHLSVVPTAVAPPTQPGTILGTVGYMSPEQASGQPLDFRSDQFALGSILYEMASGRKAFQRKTVAETLTAIIREEPEPLAQIAPTTPPPLRWIVERCLAKDREDRYVSTRDLARDLASIRDHLSETSASGGLASLEAGPRHSRKIRIAVLGLGVLASVLLAGVLVGWRLARVELPSFRQLTFRRGPIWYARFGSDGKTVVYSASWNGRPTEVFVSSPESPELRSFGLPGADVAAVSSQGEIAVLLGSHSGAFDLTHAGTLARMSATGGGAPRRVLDDVEFADWSPDGRELAVVRSVGGRRRLEYPIEKTLYETTGWIGSPRLSRSGDLIAFIDHPNLGDDAGRIASIDRTGKKTVLTGVFETADGLAWSPAGSEIWFTAAEVGSSRSLCGVTTSGRRRLILRVPGSMTVQDASADGRTLISRDQTDLGLVALVPGEANPRDLSWLDWSLAMDLSRDGKTILFSEAGAGGGPGASVYVRGTDGSPAVRLGEGSAMSLSPDGRWALAILHPTAEAQLVLYPTGAGQPRPVPMPGLRVLAARFLPDGERILATAAEPGHLSRIYLVADLARSKPRALTPEGWGGGLFPTDGRRFIARGPDQTLAVWPIEGGEPTPVRGVGVNDSVVGWTDNPSVVYLQRNSDSLPVRIDRLDLSTGQAVAWKELMPSDVGGVAVVHVIKISPDGKAYLYFYDRSLSDLYLVEGLK